MKHFVIDTKNINEVNIQLPENSYEIKSTSSQRMLIDLNVLANNTTDNALRILMEQGRYNIQTTKDNTSNKLCLKPSGNLAAIFINGKELKENIKYTVYIPKHINYRTSLLKAETTEVAKK
ncbi:MAG: hypothetical protein MK207_14775 [Saprospiraceae bacterium]|nr:hypothetical protein [Saprospiraceae bacterium]